MKQRIACILFEGNSSLSKIAEACIRFSPQIAVRGNEAVFLEIGACRNLYNEGTLRARIGVLLKRFGVSMAGARIAFADDPSRALAAARFGRSDPAALPLEALLDCVNPFHHDEDLAKQTARIISALRKLGLHSLEGFSRLPTRTLASRFGELGVHLSARARGRAEPTWPRFRPSEKIVERLELHESGEVGPCSDLDGLLFLVKRLADRALTRLHGRGFRAAAVTLELDSRKWLIRLPVPQGTAAGLIPIVRDRLAFDLARAPLAGPVSRLKLAIDDTAPGHRAQRDLFRPQDGEAEAWDALVGRLRQKLGSDKAFAAVPVDRYLPEKAWEKASEALDLLPTELPQRPARLLRKPLPLRKEGDALIRPERPSLDAPGRGKRWDVAEWHGPERIAVEWWMDPKLEGFSRDYYRIVTVSGEQLWVYSMPSRMGFYLHGYFD